MVGKPNLTAGNDSSKQHQQHHGAARVTPGLNALDEEREASMADEGGTSGAVMEDEDQKSDRDFRRRSVIGQDTDFQAKDLKDEPTEYEESVPLPFPLWMLGALGGIVAIGFFGFGLPYLFRSYRERSRMNQIHNWSDQLEEKFKTAS